MNEQQLAAVKQALAALEGADQIDVDMDKAITALQSIISQDALYKMAEESRTSGLKLDDWDKIGCVNHDCDKCKAVQEPVFCEYCGGNDDADFGLPTDHCTDCARPQPVPVKTYHDGKPWPVQPKPWVGLTEKERDELYAAHHDSCGYPITATGYEKAIEAKLKEKNA
jgi:hypothetical protein